ncbi:MAG: hypothetical protein LBK22_02635 [Tannerella sp.]|jgi:hypothetical protein|nr:hypothetical protein [Tannerella sp.]
MNASKDILYKELNLKAFIGSEGLKFDPRIFLHNVGSRNTEIVHCLFDYSVDENAGVVYPLFLRLPHGLVTIFKPNANSPLSLEWTDGRYYVIENGNVLTEVFLLDRPQYYGLKTSDGAPMKNIAADGTDGVVFITYSNECALIEKGKDCLFCNINYTKRTYGDAEGIGWKYPKQIGETVAAAYRLDGKDHLTLSGGFIPERREVDYYVDVAEAIQEHTGLDDFNGTACVGAPHDFNALHKLRDAGFRTLATNLELWDRNFFKAYCPGKDALCGGYDHWVKSLEYSVKVFGFGHVRSNFVGGLEPMTSVLEGIEYLAGKGVVAYANAWIPNNGSALEGHRSPGWQWHLELAQRNYRILDRAGITWEQVYSASAYPLYPICDIYRIEKGLYN